jgi:hypothetical protein
MDYGHTQTSSAALILAIGVFLIVVGLVGILAEDDEGLGWWGYLIFIVVAGAAFIFNRLTVTVAAGKVDAVFGFGWPRHSIDVLDIVAIRQVRNRWWYGFGIRRIPNGTMYNVWGLDAVEIELKSGKVFRIGTDDGPDLLAAISLHTSLRPSIDGT